MLFGNVDPFAIEAELREIYGKWTYGKLRFWVNGHAIGDFDDTSDLASSARWGRTFLRASPQRTRAELDDLTPTEVYEMLYGQFVQPVNNPSREPLPGRWNHEPYVLDDVGESAVRDKYAIVVVRRADGSDRMLVNCFDEERVTEVIIPSGNCDQVIEAYCDWVEALRENGNPRSAH